MQKYKIRKIEEKDNLFVEQLIRTCLLEFGGNREGTAWCDPDLGKFSEVYNKLGHQYWVVEDTEGKIVGGAGIGKLTEEVCELQKMYFLKEARGTGIAAKLMERCLTYAKMHYHKCYIETFSNMIAANKFYQKYGFERLERPYLETEHFSCDVWYIKELKPLQFCANAFGQLSTGELYEILKARTEIFLMEQDIKYQDKDDIDYDSVHCFIKDGEKVVAYLRAFYKGEGKDVVQVGRVLSLYHGIGLGEILMKNSIRIIQRKMQCKKITMDSQVHAIGFYEKLGFQVTSDMFLEAGLEHVVMELDVTYLN